MVALAVSAEGLQEHVVSGWLIHLGIFVTTAVLLFILKFILFAFGKEHLIKDRQKYLYIPAALLFLGSLYLVEHFRAQAMAFNQQLKLSNLQLKESNQRLEEIREATFKKGGMRAGFLALIPVLNSTNIGIEEYTNAVQPSMSGIGVPAEKISARGIDLLLVVKIDNAGDPSILWNWKSSVILPGGTRLEALIPSITITSIKPVPTVIGPYLFRMEDNLLQSTATSPVATGAGKIGWLPIHVVGITEIPVGARVCLSFDDVRGRETKLEFVWTDTNPKK